MHSCIIGCQKILILYCFYGMQLRHLETVWFLCMLLLKVVRQDQGCSAWSWLFPLGGKSMMSSSHLWGSQSCWSAPCLSAAPWAWEQPACTIEVFTPQKWPVQVNILRGNGTTLWNKRFLCLTESVWHAQCVIMELGDCKFKSKPKKPIHFCFDFSKPTSSNQ